MSDQAANDGQPQTATAARGTLRAAAPIGQLHIGLEHGFELVGGDAAAVVDDVDDQSFATVGCPVRPHGQHNAGGAARAQTQAVAHRIAGQVLHQARELGAVGEQPLVLPVHAQAQQGGRVGGLQRCGHAVEHVAHIDHLGVRLQRALLNRAELAELVEHGHRIVGSAHLLAQQLGTPRRVALFRALQGLGVEAHRLQRLAQVMADAGQQLGARALKFDQLGRALVQAGDQAVALGLRACTLEIDPQEHEDQHRRHDPQARKLRD